MVQSVMAVKLNHRSTEAPKFQECLTRHGCIINVRLGIHETGNVCSEDGLILLQLSGEKDDLLAFERELNSMDGVTTKSMEI